MQGHVAVVAQLAQRDAQPVPAPIRTTASASRSASSPARILVRASSSTTSRSRGSVLARAAAISLAASRSASIWATAAVSASISSAARRYWPASQSLARCSQTRAGLDRGVPGLGLHRLQRHPGLAQPGQAGNGRFHAPARPGGGRQRGSHPAPPPTAAGHAAAPSTPRTPGPSVPRRAVRDASTHRARRRTGSPPARSGDGRPCPPPRPAAGRRPVHRRTEGPAPRTGAARPATSPAPSPGPGACAARPPAGRPPPVTRSAAGSAAPAPAGPSVIASSRPAGGSSGHPAPG
jgi:hypothetical protein